MSDAASPATAPVPPVGPRRAAIWAIVVLLACCAGLLLYIRTIQKTHQARLRELTEQTRRELGKREEQINQFQAARLDRHDLARQVQSLREQLARTGAGPIQVAPDSHSAVTQGPDRQAGLWRLDTGKRVAAFPSAEQLAYSADGAWLAVLDGRGAVSIHDTQTGKQLDVINAGAPCTGVLFSPTGLRLGVTIWASGRDATTQLWEVATPQENVHLRKLHTLTGELLRFSRDGGRCLTRAGGFTVWETATGRKLATFPPADAKEFKASDLTDGTLSPDGRFFTAQTKRGQLLIGEVETGKMRAAAPGS